MSINSQKIELSSAVSIDNVYYGQCMEESCFKFVEDSLPIDLGDDTGRDSILLTFMFGSSGTLLEYSKLEKFTLRITVDDEGLDLYETEGKVSEKINLNSKSSGDLITVQIITSSNEIEIRVDDESKKISYDSGGGFWFFSDDSDDKYKILFGGSSNDGARFMGKLINFFIKGRPLDMAAYQTSNSLERCVPPSPPRKERVKEAVKDRDHFTC